MTEKTIHEGRNVKRIREILGIKQDALAAELGLSQQAISALEQKEKIDEKILNDVAKSLKVSPDAIKTFNDDAAVNYINTFTENSVNNGAVYAFNSTINPMEKFIATMEENKKLYERLLQTEKEKVALLEKMLDKK
ncbi:MAG TPA: helix-turn-helix transcriptional regulator [Chitinophagaceae bacterium]|nr:helix-turn-helix transcriptional regulator [Chitinophagaceae bacterium]